jgi:hypothetical protein
LWTLAIAFGVADASLLTGLAVFGVGVATLARTGSAGLRDIAGAQAVLGAAGLTGSAAAIGASWASAVSLVSVARHRGVSAALGIVAGVVVAGPSPAGGYRSAGVWVAAAIVGAGVGLVVAPGTDARRWQQYVALVAGGVGVALGILAGYH